MGKYSIVPPQHAHFGGIQGSGGGIGMGMDMGTSIIGGGMMGGPFPQGVQTVVDCNLGGDVDVQSHTI
jgi:hypothetical protein